MSNRIALCQKRQYPVRCRSLARISNSFRASWVNPHPRVTAPLSVVLPRFLDAAVKDRIPRQAAILIEVNGESQHFALMVAKPEGLARLVFLDQLIDEVNRADVFDHCEVFCQL
jgi:hypothetical protein